ncbi:MAG TPA: hypothetical protein VHZ09_16160 [Acidobacteriaceae bacterium]|nr:hypothetical protein [Acidobacteriaceae bacterium]
MNPLRRMGIYLLFCALVSLSHPFPAFAQTTAAPSATGTQQLRDGQHDFDFNFGTWRTHIQRRVNPLSPGPAKWVEMTGTVSVRKIWDGRAQMEEIDASGPGGHLQGLTLFLYNPESHQWSQTFARIDDGVLGTPAIGEFKDGKGDLYDQEMYNGRAILVRAEWSQIKPDSHHFEQAFSNDGGKTWEPNFEASLTRLSEDATAEPDATLADAQQRAFDFDLGTWKMHSRRMMHPLTGAKDWAEMTGVTRDSKVWGGRANLAIVEFDAPSHLQLLALRLYNPQSHQWSTNFATSGVGVLNAPVGHPVIGDFKDGQGEFYDQEPYNGRTILIRFRIGPVSADTAHSDQAFSDDGGKTWEINWVNDYTRIPDTNGDGSGK